MKLFDNTGVALLFAGVLAGAIAMGLSGEVSRIDPNTATLISQGDKGSGARFSTPENSAKFLSVGNVEITSFERILGGSNRP